MIIQAILIKPQEGGDRPVPTLTAEPIKIGDRPVLMPQQPQHPVDDDTAQGYAQKRRYWY